MNKKNLDQFYTKKYLAKKFFEITTEIICQKKISYDLWLEPSAGTGAFFDFLPENKIGIDLEPKSEGIIQHDFLTYFCDDKKYISIGNPPFGKNSSLAIKFFNRCAENSVLIAFIVPKTFKKENTWKQLNNFFHICYEEDLPEYSFEFDNKDYNVPCVFQIWEKLEYKREKIVFLRKNEDFHFVKKENADFAIQRVGANAGKVKIEFQKYAPQSHYFISANDNIRKIFENIDWNTVKYNTAGNPSISKHELISLYENIKRQNSREKPS